MFFAFAVAGCSEIQGSKTVDTTPPGTGFTGPGLFTGKEGGIVIYEKVWGGAGPGGEVAE